MKWIYSSPGDLTEENLFGVQRQCIIKMTSKELPWPSSITFTKLPEVTLNVQKPVFPQNRLLTSHQKQARNVKTDLRML